MTRYTVTATREDGWWSLIATDVVHGREVASQSRRLDQADAAIREAIALVLDVEGDSFEVEVVPALDQTAVSDETLGLLDLRRQLAEMSERSRRLTPTAVAELRGAGLTVRDVAELLGVTPSRVSQIEHGSPWHALPAEPWPDPSPAPDSRYRRIRVGRLGSSRCAYITVSRPVRKPWLWARA